MLRLLLLIIPFTLYCQLANCSLSCKDESGKNVDWFITYKLPRVDHDNPNIDDGVAYAYIGPEDSDWKLSKSSINSNKSAVGATLNPIYEQTPDENNFYILYNDENPYGPVSYTDGHAKGVVAFDVKSGFWLVHSVPKFPPHLNESYYYPKSGQVYGQSALCISVDIDQAINISKILYYDNPSIYDYYLPEEIAEKFPEVAKVVKGKHVTEAPWNETIILKSRKNFPFQVFGKYKKFNKDLYSSWLGPFFQNSLLAETWQNDPEKLPSDCESEFTVENVLEISFADFNLDFKSTRDHSKIAVSKRGDVSHSAIGGWICIGDINRTKGQKKRGGGTVCMVSPSIWKAFHKVIKQVDSCKSNL